MSERLDVLAIGAHPDDVELSCGGTLALLAARGLETGIVHLTRGEMGTRGTPEERKQEAERAAQALNATALHFLDCGDGGLRTGTAEQDTLVEILRAHRPEMVLGPPPSDRHPDHARAYQLVTEACFYAGLVRRGTGDPHRPAAVYSYMQHDPFEPSFIVDVTESWQAKMAALDEYKSQIYQGPVEDSAEGPVEGEGERDEPATKVSSRAYRAAIEGRARHFGMLIGAEFGEPFWSRLPLAVADPWALRPGRMR